MNPALAISSLVERRRDKPAFSRTATNAFATGNDGTECRTATVRAGQSFPEIMLTIHPFYVWRKKREMVASLRDSGTSIVSKASQPRWELVSC
jgi:hypothetical protein